MPHIAIKLLEGKIEELKRKLTTALVKTAPDVLGYGEDSFSVSNEDFTFEKWKTKVYPDAFMGHKVNLYKKPGY